MGGGASKSKTNLSVPGGHHSIHSRERRMSHIETNPPPQSEKLVQCPHCDRSFAEDRVDRHVDVSSFIYLTAAGIVFLEGNERLCSKLGARLA